VRLRRQNGVCSHARNTDADTDSVKRVPENIVSATRIVVFLKFEALVNQLTVSGGEGSICSAIHSSN